MKKKPAKLVAIQFDPLAPPPLTQKQERELAALSQIPDEKIDTSDIPVALSDGDEGERGRFYKPRKAQITARVDADVLDWLKAQGRGYQGRMNAILRREMLAARKNKRSA